MGSHTYLKMIRHINGRWIIDEQSSYMSEALKGTKPGYLPQSDSITICDERNRIILYNEWSLDLTGFDRMFLPFDLPTRCFQNQGFRHYLVPFLLEKFSTLNSIEKELDSIFHWNAEKSEYWTGSISSINPPFRSENKLPHHLHGWHPNEIALFWGLVEEDGFLVVDSPGEGEDFLARGSWDFRSGAGGDFTSYSPKQLKEKGWLQNVRMLCVADRQERVIRYCDFLPPLHPRYFSSCWHSWTISLVSFRELARDINLETFLLLIEDDLEALVDLYLSESRRAQSVGVSKEYLMEHTYGVSCM